jgi:hypothetical protein
VWKMSRTKNIYLTILMVTGIKFEYARYS